MKNFFIPQGNFTPEEWMLRYKVMSLLIIAFTIGVYIFGFGIYRILHDNILLGIVELIFSVFLLTAFLYLRANKSYYEIFAKIFFVLVYILLIVLFIFIPEQATRIHWVPSALVFIFFLLDYKGGIFFLGLYLLFIVYLIFTGFNYSVIEYTTWISSLLSIAIVMYYYEKVKEKEKLSLQTYAEELKDEVNKQTKVLEIQNIKLQENQNELQRLNTKLEERVEEELTQRLAQEKMLLQQCRLASMGEMIDSIAHQWRQPLMNINAILMNMDRIIELEQNPQKKLENKMDEVVVLTTHMSQTIEDFRSLFKTNKVPITFNISDTIISTLELFKSALKEIEIMFDDTKPYTYHGQHNEFRQVLLIIVSNAIEALEEQQIKNPTLIITITQATHESIITIEDNAGGVPEKSIEHIFDPYFTTKEPTGGTGLGLYIAKIIIEQSMQGVLSVKNTKKGAKFTITLREKNAINT